MLAPGMKASDFLGFAHPIGYLGPLGRLIFILIAAAGVVALGERRKSDHPVSSCNPLSHQRTSEPPVEPAVLQNKAAGLGAL